MKKIITDNLILRKFKEDDYIEMFENWASNENVSKNAGWPVHKNSSITRDLVKIWVNEYQNENVYNWIITHKKTNKAIGSITVVSKDMKNRVCEIGYNIGEKWWNNGYATEALKVVIDYLFSLDLFDVITASCFEDNIASKRVLEKNGFMLEGILRNRVIVNNVKKNLLQFSLLK